MGAAAGAKVNALDPDKAHLTLKLLFAAIGVILKLLGRGQKSLDIYIFSYIASFASRSMRRSSSGETTPLKSTVTLLSPI